MRALIALILALYVGSAFAHALPVPFHDVGSLRDVTHQTALGTLGGRVSVTVPQITCNLVTGVASVGGPCASPAATCNGDVQTASLTVTSTNGSSTFTITGGTFSNAAAPTGDVGKVISIDGAGDSGGRYIGTITGVSGTGTQTITTNANAQTALAAVSKTVYWGSSDSAAFAAFNTWARANQGASNQVVLTIPNGSSCWFGNGSFVYVNLFNAFAAGINNLIVEGTGATISSVGGQGFFLAAVGVCQAGLASGSGCSARLQTVNPGDTIVTLTAASLAAGYISRFNAVAGQWVMLGGTDTQGLFISGFGYPPNATFFEWRQITSVNAGTGQITLDRPVANYYSASWPSFNSGSNFEADAGGPATIYTVGNSGGGTQNSWNTTVEYRGLTISQEGQTYANGRNVTYRNVTFTGGHGAIPTQNETWSAINTSFNSVNMETDKLVGTMLLDGVTINQIVNQSTSTERLIIRNSTVTNRLDGGAKYTEITDSVLNNFGPGTFAYGNTGVANQTICTRCNITTLNYNMNGGYTNAEAWYFKSGGVITMPLSAAQGSGPGQRVFVPGAQITYVGSTTNPPTSPLFACCESIGSFAVQTITSDPWPALDNQTVSASVTSTNGSATVTVSGSSFSSGDIGKTIIIPGARDAGGNPADLATFITGVSGSGPQNLTVYNTANRSQVAATQTLQWGTSNMYVQTNQSGGFPDLSSFSTARIGFKIINSWNFTCDSCTGDPNAVGASIQAGATPSKPLGSFATITYTPTSAQGGLSAIQTRGVFKSLRINVTAAATSGGNVALNPGGQCHWFMINQNNFPTALATFDWLPADFSINLKQAGDRVITPSGVTCNTGGGPVAGGCAGDTINLPANLATMWIQQGSMGPYMGSTFTGAPTFTITMQTDPLQ